MIRAFLVNFSATLLATGLSTAATLLIVQSLSPADWGLSASTLGLGQLLGACVSFGTQIERVRRYSSMAADVRGIEAKTDSWARIFVAASIVLVGCAVFAFSSSAGVVLMTAAGVYASLSSTSYFIASKQFLKAGGVVSAEKLLLLLLVGTAVLTDWAGPLTLPLAQGLAGLGVAAVATCVIRSPALRLSLKAHAGRLRSQYTSGLYLGVASLAPSFLLLDASIVLAIAGPTEAGAFALAARLVAPLTVATSALVAVLMPFLISTPDAPTGNNFRSLLILTAVYFSALAVLAASAALWVPSFFGTEYEDSVTPVQLYVANAFAVFFTRVLVTLGQARGDDKVMSALVTAQVALALAGIGVGASVAGSSGAAVSVVSTNVLLSVALGIRTWKRRHKDSGALS